MRIRRGPLAALVGLLLVFTLWVAGAAPAGATAIGPGVGELMGPATPGATPDPAPPERLADLRGR